MDLKDYKEDAEPMVRFKWHSNGIGPWLFWTVLALLVFKACGVSLW